jgi:hypothetical protein
MKLYIKVPSVSLLTEETQTFSEEYGISLGIISIETKYFEADDM